MPVIDCQVHLCNRTYLEAHVHRRDEPCAERTLSGYVFHIRRGRDRLVTPSHYEFEQQLKYLDAQGVDIAVSSMGGFTVDHLPAERAMELAMRLNEERAELERRYPGRYYGLAVLPMQNAQAALETLEHAVRTLGARGICVGTDVGGESIAAPPRLPVFQRIAELGVPVFLHPTLGLGSAARGSAGPIPRTGPVAALLDLVSSGVLDRNPTLRVVPLHLGGAMPGTQQRRALTDHLASFLVDTVSLDAPTLRAAARSWARGHLIYGSDYPYRRPAAMLRLVRRELAPELADGVLYRSAASLLGLGRAAPAPRSPAIAP